VTQPNSKTHLPVTLQHCHCSIVTAALSSQVYTTEKDLVLVMELASQGELFGELDNGPLPEVSVRAVLSQAKGSH